MAKIGFNKPGGRPVKVVVGYNPGPPDPPDPPDPFTPPDSPGLLAWYDIADSEAITVDGSNRITEILDKSGNDFHLNDKDAAANYPLYNASGGGNGKAYIKCQQLTEINGAATVGDTITIYLVFRLNSGTNNLSHIVPMNAAKTTGIGALFSYPNQTLYANAGGINRIGKGFGVSYDWQIARFTFKTVGSAAFGFNNYPYDWTPQNSPALSGADITQFGFGWHNSQVLNVDVSEMVVYSGEKRAPEDGKIRDYLTEKYAVQDNNEYILFFGDSITAGYFLDDANDRYSLLASQAVNLKELNWAISGLQVIPSNQLDYTANPNGQYFYDKVEFPEGYDLSNLRWVVIMYGSNDTWAVGDSTKLAAWKTHYIDAINRLKGYGIPANKIVVGNPPYQSVREPAYVTLLPAIDEVITTTGVVKCDFHTAMEIAGGDALLSDGIHPTAEGHQIMADTLIPLLT